MNQEQAMQEQYPGVELAYPLAVASYDTIIKRLDFVDGRIQTLLAFAVTTIAIVPSVANARGIAFRSIWFYFAILAVAAILVVGSYARHTGTIAVLNPAILYEKWLAHSEWEFKKNLIYWAGVDFASNSELLVKKWQLSVAITFLFFLETVFLVAWVAAAVL
jgi:hypothetical protein